MDDFSHLLIKPFNYWRVMLHSNQSYLGRCVLWCDRADAADLFDISLMEREELWEVAGRLKIAISRLWAPDRFNYASLGNNATHLHIHVIPRYANERRFGDHVFQDARWGKNPFPYDKTYALAAEILESIRAALASALS